MNYVLFCSHGRLCEGMLDTLKIFSLYDESRMKAIPFYTEGIDSEKTFDDFLSNLGSEDQAVIFTDVQFGSVNQFVTGKCMGMDHIHIISGMNLMVVLEILSFDEPFEEDFIRGKVQDSQASIVYMRDFQISYSEEDE